MNDDGSSCPLCSGMDLRMVGYRGLGLIFLCLNCKISFVETMSLFENNGHNKKESLQEMNSMLEEKLSAAVEV